MFLEIFELLNLYDSTNSIKLIKWFDVLCIFIFIIILFVDYYTLEQTIYILYTLYTFIYFILHIYQYLDMFCRVANWNKYSLKIPFQLYCYLHSKSTLSAFCTFQYRNYSSFKKQIFQPSLSYYKMTNACQKNCELFSI